MGGHSSEAFQESALRVALAVVDAWGGKADDAVLGPASDSAEHELFQTLAHVLGCAFGRDASNAANSAAAKLDLAKSAALRCPQLLAPHLG